MNTREFFEAIFGDREGFIGFATKSSPEAGFDQSKFFKYPDLLPQAESYVRLRAEEDVTFSPMIYRVPARRASAVTHTPVLYADTDTFPIDEYLVPPSLNIETSPGHHASFWFLDDDYPPEQVEAVCKVIALTHARKVNGKQAGVDPGGWDLSQLLRVPGTSNNKYLMKKYEDTYIEPYPVFVSSGEGTVYSLAEVAEVYSPEKLAESAPPVELDETFPEELPEHLPLKARVANDEYLRNLGEREPIEGLWSEMSYAFVSELLRKRYTPEEALVLLWNAPFNKYERDNRTIQEMWRYDILKAVKDPANRPESVIPEVAADPKSAESRTVIPMEHDNKFERTKLTFLTDNERKCLHRTFIHDYTDWVHTKSPDAPDSYQIASALTILSCIFGEWGRVNAQFDDDLGLNLSFVIAGESTQTFKSTSRNAMKKLLKFTQVGDYNYTLTSDVTPETIIDELALRPYKSSLYDRDEAQQLIADIKGGKGYLKGFFETLNELYDGKAHARARKGHKTEETRVNFIQYLMGIQSQIQENLELHDFESGWGMRNIYVIGRVADDVVASKRRRFSQGAKTTGDDGMKKLAVTLMRARDFWKNKFHSIETPGHLLFEDDAWERLQDFADDLVDKLAGHPRAPYLLSAATRLGINTIKVAALLAMVETKERGDMHDALTAISLAETWVDDLVTMVEGVASSAIQRNLDEIVTYIENHGGVVTRAAILRWWTQTKGSSRKDFIDALETLKDSDLVEIGPDVKDRLCVKLI